VEVFIERVQYSDGYVQRYVEPVEPGDGIGLDSDVWFFVELEVPGLFS
jgi:hypothetical protein